MYRHTGGKSQEILGRFDFLRSPQKVCTYNLVKVNGS